MSCGVERDRRVSACSERVRPTADATTYRRPTTVIYRKVGWLEFNVPFQHKYGYIGDEIYRKMADDRANAFVLAGAPWVAHAQLHSKPMRIFSGLFFRHHGGFCRIPQKK